MYHKIDRQVASDRCDADGERCVDLHARTVNKRISMQCNSSTFGFITQASYVHDISIGV